MKPRSVTATPAFCASSLPPFALRQVVADERIVRHSGNTAVASIAEGVNRPGAMQRQVPGLTAKVLNERLRKLARFGIIERQIFAEVPPRVEYRLTAFGRRFDGVLKEIAALDSVSPR